MIKVVVIFCILFETSVIASNDFEVIHDFARAISGNTSYLELKSFEFHKINRTTAVADVQFSLSQEVTEDDDITFFYRFYMWRSNTYKRTPIQFSWNLCDLITTNKFNIIGVLSDSTVKSCPLKKGRHYINNIMPSSKGWPHAFPEGRYMMEIELFFRKESIITLQWMVQVVPVFRDQ